MATDLSQLPRDENGVVTGSYRLRHRDPGFNDGVAGVSFTGGLSQPLSGYDLVRMVVAMGGDLDLEPEPEQSDEPAVQEPAEPTPQAPMPIMEPDQPGEPQAARAADLPSDRDALAALLVARGLSFDPKWSVRRMQALLAAAR